MKKISILMMSLLPSLLVSVFAFTACSGDEDEGGDKSFSLTYGYEGTQKAYIDWDMAEYGMLDSFWLKFGDGIPVGSTWNLECDRSWLRLKNTHGVVNKRTESISIVREHNENYEDRIAIVQLNVSGGVPVHLDMTTVTVMQYGYEHYLHHGATVAFKTNRTIATSSTLEISGLVLPQVSEVDWGDGKKEIIKNYLGTTSISHQYDSRDTYTVKLRIPSSFSFKIARGQGVEEVRLGSSGYFQTVNPSKTTYIGFKDGFYVKQ